MNEAGARHACASFYKSSSHRGAVVPRVSLSQQAATTPHLRGGEAVERPQDGVDLREPVPPHRDDLRHTEQRTQGNTRKEAGKLRPVADLALSLPSCTPTRLRAQPHAIKTQVQCIPGGGGFDRVAAKEWLTHKPREPLQVSLPKSSLATWGPHGLRTHSPHV